MHSLSQDAIIQRQEDLVSSSKLLVGRLSHSVTREKLAILFSNYGKVVQITLFEGKGFGFVEMSSGREAKMASEALHDLVFEGLSIICVTRQ